MTPLRRRILLIGIPTLVLLAAGAAGVAVHRHRSSPEYALQQVAQAIRAHDRTAFERRVDVDALTSSATDEMIAHWVSTAFVRAADTGESGGRALALTAGMTMMENMKPALVSSARGNLLHAVEKGAMDSLFAAPEAEAGKPHFGHMARSILGTPPRVEGVGPVRRSGPLAIADVHLHDPVLQARLTLRLRMERGADGWRVVRIDNARDYLTRVSQLQQARLAVENRRIRRWLDETVRLGEPRVRLTPRLYAGEFMEVEVPVTNTGRDTLTGLALTLEYLGAPMKQDDAVPRNFDPIAPGQTALARTMLVQYNPYIEWHGTLRFGTLTPRVRNVFVTRKGEPGFVEELNDWAEYMDWREEHHLIPPSAPAAGTAKS